MSARRSEMSAAAGPSEVSAAGPPDEPANAAQVLAITMTTHLARSEQSRVNAFGLLMIRTSNGDLNKQLICTLLTGETAKESTKSTLFSKLEAQSNYNFSLIYKNKNGRYKIQECRKDRQNMLIETLVLVDDKRRTESDFSTLGILTPLLWNKSGKIAKSVYLFKQGEYNELLDRFGGQDKAVKTYEESEESEKSEGVPKRTYRSKAMSKVARFGRAVGRNARNYIVAPFGGKLAQMSISKAPRKSASPKPDVEWTSMTSEGSENR